MKSGLLVAARGGVSRLGAADRGPLPDILSIWFDGVGVVVDFAIEPRVNAGHMIALEIVIDVSLPVTVHLVSAALGKLHAAEVELPRLSG